MWLIENIISSVRISSSLRKYQTNHLLLNHSHKDLSAGWRICQFKLSNSVKSYHVPRSAGRKGGVVVQPLTLQVSLKPKAICSSFESLPLNLSHHNWKSEKPLLYIVVYQPPATAYAQFLSEFSHFLSSLVVSSDKIVIMGAFSIYPVSEWTDTVTPYIWFSPIV